MTEVGERAEGVVPDWACVFCEAFVGGGRRRRVRRVWRGGRMSKVAGGRAFVEGAVGDGGRVAEGMIKGLRADDDFQSIME